MKWDTYIEAQWLIGSQVSSLTCGFCNPKICIQYSPLLIYCLDKVIHALNLANLILSKGQIILHQNIQVLKISGMN